MQDLLLDDRVAVLADVWDTRAVQTVAAFASLHVAITVTTCLVAELLRLPRWVRLTGWAFAALTCLSTVYLGWHFFVDVLGGFAVGTLSLVLAAWATGHPLRRRDRTWSLGEARGPRGRAGPPLTGQPVDEGVPEPLGVGRRLAVAVLGARPEEAAQPVALGARDHVEVEVRDGLADRVVDRHERPLRAEGVLDRRREPLGRREEPVALPCWEVREGLEVGARHEQDVPLEDRPGVEERHQVVGLQHEVTGHLARDDLAEHASVHVTDGATGHRHTCAATIAARVEPARGEPAAGEPPTGRASIPRGDPRGGDLYFT